MKSSADEIRERFDGEVERFSNLETGQAATVDARLCMELVTSAAAGAALGGAGARDLLDIGCGAGNYTLMMLREIADLNCTLVDLSPNMLARARERVARQTRGTVRTLAGDMRELELGTDTQDIVLASATLHHLRTDDEWRAMFGKIFAALRSGGSFWIFDLIEHRTPAIQALMKRRWGEYLVSLRETAAEGAAYRDEVFAYIEREDTPRSLEYQMGLLEETGFVGVEVLHKNALFAAFGARKG